MYRITRPSTELWKCKLNKYSIFYLFPCEHRIHINRIISVRRQSRRIRNDGFARNLLAPSAVSRFVECSSLHPFSLHLRLAFGDELKYFIYDFYLKPKQIRKCRSRGSERAESEMCWLRRAEIKLALSAARFGLAINRIRYKYLYGSYQLMRFVTCARASEGRAMSTL